MKMKTLACLVVLIGSAVAQDAKDTAKGKPKDAPKGKPTAPKSPGETKADAEEKPAASRLVPDPRYRPKVGDRMHVFLGGGKVPVAADPDAIRDLVKILRLNDQGGAAGLEKSGGGFLLDSATPVLVTGFDDGRERRPPPPGGPEMVRSGQAFNRALLEAGIADDGPPFYELRILDGPHKDKRAYAPVALVRRLVTAPPGKSRARKRR